MRRWVPRGIRLRLVLAISAVSVAAVAASFFALHATTAASLRSRIDRELNEQYAEFQQHALSSAQVTGPASLRWVASSSPATSAEAPAISRRQLGLAVENGCSPSRTARHSSTSTERASRSVRASHGPPAVAPNVPGTGLAT